MAATVVAVPHEASVRAWDTLRVRLKDALVGRPLPLLQADGRACPAASLYAGGRAVADDLARHGIDAGALVAVTTSDPFEVTTALLAGARLSLRLLMVGGGEVGTSSGDAPARAPVTLAPGNGLLPAITTAPEDTGLTSGIGVGFVARSGHADAMPNWWHPDRLAQEAGAIIKRRGLQEGSRLLGWRSFSEPGGLVRLLLPALLAGAELEIVPRQRLRAVSLAESPTFVAR